MGRVFLLSFLVAATPWPLPGHWEAPGDGPCQASWRGKQLKRGIIASGQTPVRRGEVCRMAPRVRGLREVFTAEGKEANGSIEI